MWTAKWILDTYEGGNEADRLQMYLVYPDLRMHFDELEMQPAKVDKPGDDPEKEKSSGPWWNCWCRMVRG